MKNTVFKVEDLTSEILEQYENQVRDSYSSVDDADVLKVEDPMTV